MIEGVFVNLFKRNLSPVGGQGGGETQEKKSSLAAFFDSILKGWHSPGFEVQHSTPKSMFIDMARRAELENPVQVFSLKPDERDKFLSIFVQHAVEQGFAAGKIARTLIKFRYAAKLAKYMDTSEDQAAGAIVLSNTVKVNWFEVLEGGRPVIEVGKNGGGKLLNGIFGRRLASGSEINPSDAVADTLYLPVHDQEKHLPQSPWILFGSKIRNLSELEEKRKEVAGLRAEFKRIMKKGIAGKNGNFYVLDDKTHKDTTKFRLTCVVFCMENGRLFVVTGKEGIEPVPFVEWASREETLLDVLSCAKQDLDAMRKIVHERGLSDALRNPPRKLDRGYRPWGSLLKDVGDYKTACNVWRLARILAQIENVKRYESRWATIKQVEEIMEAERKVGCDDSRQGKDISVLGGILTKAEFFENVEKLRKGRGTHAECLTFAPHEFCGFLTACHSLHLTFGRMKEVINQEGYDKHEPQAWRERNRGFFRDSIKLVLEQENEQGAVRDSLFLRAHLPPYLQEEYDRHAQERAGNGEEAHEKGENRKFVELVYDMFASRNDRMRSVIRRGVETGVLELDEEGFLRMPAAEETHRKLRTFFGYDYGKTFASTIGTLIIEEVARRTFERYEGWMNELPAAKRIEMEMYLENFRTGQATVIPKTPELPEDYVDTRRSDFFLSTRFTKEEIREFGLEGHLYWDISK